MLHLQPTTAQIAPAQTTANNSGMRSQCPCWGMRTHQHDHPGRRNRPRTAASSAATKHAIQQNSANTTTKQKLTCVADKTNKTHLFSSPAGPPGTSTEPPCSRLPPCSPYARQSPPFVPDRPLRQHIICRALLAPQPPPLPPPPHLHTTKAHSPLSGLLGAAIAPPRQPKIWPGGARTRTARHQKCQPKMQF